MSLQKSPGDSRR